MGFWDGYHVDNGITGLSYDFLPDDPSAKKIHRGLTLITGRGSHSEGTTAPRWRQWHGSCGIRWGILLEFHQFTRNNGGLMGFNGILIGI